MAETEKWLHYWDRLFINEMIFEITRWVLKRKAKSESTELTYCVRARINSQITRETAILQLTTINFPIACTDQTIILLNIHCD